MRTEGRTAFAVTVDAPARARVRFDARATPGTTIRRAGPLERIVLARLERIASGRLTLIAGGAATTFGASTPGLPDAIVHVHDARFWQAVALRGSVGAGEAYARGWWSSEDATAVVRLFLRNQETMQAVEGGLAFLSRPFLRLYHAFRPNSLRGSRANIGAHYDLSNELFALLLDETMTYSCGIFEEPRSTLRDASVAKIDRLCSKLGLGPRDHLLEIGTGWGAFAIHAAREYGCRVTTTTISREQHALARERIREAGLQDRIDLLFQDYRRLQGTYDKIVSVEMIEAVGHRFLGSFFEQCSRLLRPDGVMALQSITIADQHYERARRSVDFIQRHIFPGCCIPSVTSLCTSMTRSSDLRLIHLEDIGPHYARTLAAWRANLRERWTEARALGYSEDFLRLWSFYFCYCEGGFAERHLSDVQMCLARPAARPEPILPPPRP